MKLDWKRLACGAACAAFLLVSCQKTESPGAGSASGSANANATAPTPDPHPPFGILDTPRPGDKVAVKSWGSGWALDDSGILQVTAKFDNGAVSPAKIGQPFPGVAAAYPNLPENDKAGFIFGIPELPAGLHTMTVEIVAKDGGKTELTRQIQIQ
jgi:hypothetical protein